MSPGQAQALSQLTDELVAVLGAVYAAFLRERLERRASRRGKVHRRSFLVLADMVKDMLVDAGPHTDAMWHLTIAELDRDRGEIEADVLAHHGFVVVEHEWPAFVEYVEQFTGSSSGGQT